MKFYRDLQFDEHISLIFRENGQFSHHFTNIIAGDFIVILFNMFEKYVGVFLFFAEAEAIKINVPRGQSLWPTSPCGQLSRSIDVSPNRYSAFEKSLYLI